MKKKLNSGQALLIILLIMAVGLTIGLAVVSRSVTDIRISQEQEESSRAFSAAEAGLEHLLAGVSPGDLPSFGDFNIGVDTRSLGGEGKTSFVFPKEIKAGNIQTVWLVDHTEGGDLGSEFYSGNNLTFYWGNENVDDGSDICPALEVVIIYKDGAGKFQSRRVAFDPNNGRVASNDFTLISKASYPLEDKTFAFKADFTDNEEGTLFPTGEELYAIRIKLLYNVDGAHILGVQGNADLPLQGHCYQVTAISQAETGISSKVEQCQLYKAPPAIFDYVLFSEENLSK